MNFDEKIPALWHAFTALAHRDTQLCHVGQLKVLTQNLASKCLGLHHLQNHVDDHFHTETSFQEYCKFLKDEFVQVTTPVSEQLPEIRKVSETDCFDEICWMLCKKQYHSEFALAGTLTRNAPLLYKLWRLFNTKAEEDDMGDHGQVMIPVVTHVEELIWFLTRFLEKCAKSFNKEEFEKRHEGLEFIGFKEVVKILDTDYCENIHVEIVESAVKDIYEEMIQQVLQKGWIVKRAPGPIGSTKTRWFVLTPYKLTYYVKQTEKVNELKGELKMKNGKVTCDTSSRAKRFKVTCENKTLDLSCTDEDTLKKWLNSFTKALELSQSSSNRFTDEFRRRMSARHLARAQRLRDQRHREEEERKKRKREEDMMAEMEKERQARAELEKLHNEAKEKFENLMKRLQEIEMQRKALESQSTVDKEALERLEHEKERLEFELGAEAEFLEIEKKKRKELEMAYEDLTNVLEKERQALHDEEIVRKLQAQALCEEMQKREEIERQEQKLQELLTNVQLKSQELESQRHEQERQLKQEKERLEALERDREKRDKELSKALKELDETMKSKKDLEELIETKKKQIPQTFQDKLEKFKLFKCDPNKINSHRGEGAFVVAEFDVYKQKYNPSVRSTLQNRDSKIRDSQAGDQQMDQLTDEILSEAIGEVLGEASSNESSQRSSQIEHASAVDGIGRSMEQLNSNTHVDDSSLGSEATGDQCCSESTGVCAGLPPPSNYTDSNRSTGDLKRNVGGSWKKPVPTPRKSIINQRQSLGAQAKDPDHDEAAPPPLPLKRLSSQDDYLRFGMEFNRQKSTYQSN